MTSPKATDETRTTPVSRAWRRTVAWLRTVRANKTAPLVKSAKWKLLFYDHPLVAQDEPMKDEIAAFNVWKRMLSQRSLADPAWAESFLWVATKAADQADNRAAARAAERFADWLNDGPAAGLKRQHLFSRTATGWQDDTVASQPNTNLSEMDDTEGISKEQLAAAVAPTSDAELPLGAMHIANSERVS